MDEVLEMESSGRRDVERLILEAVVLGACLTGLLAVSLFILIGLLNCLTSHMHIIPSLEKETMLAFCVPITDSPHTGYL
jgi:hypothetical protein